MSSASSLLASRRPHFVMVTLMGTSNILSATVVLLSIPLAGAPSLYLFFVFPVLTIIENLLLAYLARDRPAEVYSMWPTLACFGTLLVGWSTGVGIGIADTGSLGFSKTRPAQTWYERMWFAGMLVALVHIAVQLATLGYCIYLKAALRKASQKLSDDDIHDDMPIKRTTGSMNNAQRYTMADEPTMEKDILDIPLHQTAPKFSV
ncbi:hypothetical protein EWM64_g6987 [Hericium alpestre]|uniref:Uncharacterized protein n=1 Tax=Hericium alpestre TaxID=135208 RepID=A0A4Y9ZR16_9AGAM|nr:hypothetical protein EWM64_g6987 [Hericium alpestre]